MNKDEAERCRDMGAEALRNGQYPRASKLLRKSLQLHPLPGVKALLQQAERRAAGGGGEPSSRAQSDGNGPSAGNGGGGGDGAPSIPTFDVAGQRRRSAYPAA